MSDAISRAADSLAGMVNSHKPAGFPCVLWTLVVAVALYRCDGATLTWLWPFLYWTWLGLIVLLFLGVIMALSVAAISRSRLTVEAAAPPSAEPPPGLEPSL